MAAPHSVDAGNVARRTGNRLPQAPGQFQRHGMIEGGGKRRIEIQQFLDFSFLEAQQRSFFHGACGGRSGLGLKESQFSENFTEAGCGKIAFLAVLGYVIESDASVRDDKQFPPGISLLKDRFPAPKVQIRGVFQQEVQVFLREPPKEGNQLEFFPIRSHPSIITRARLTGCRFDKVACRRWRLGIAFAVCIT